MVMSAAKLDHFLPWSLKTCIKVTVSLPLFGFAFCIVWSFLFDYEVKFLKTLS